MYTKNTIRGVAEGVAVNPFAVGGLARSPPRGMSVEAGVAPASKQQKEQEAMQRRLKRPRRLNRNRSRLPKMLVVAEQLDKLGYTSGRSNNQGLLKLRRSVALAKKEYDLLAEEMSVVDACNEEQSTQTDRFFFWRQRDDGKRNHDRNLPKWHDTRRGKKRSAEVSEPSKRKETDSASNQDLKPVVKRASQVPGGQPQ